jgi:hypothetical protein
VEQYTTFVSSRGLLRSCDAYNQRPVSSRPDIDSSLLQGHRAGGSIYVCSDALADFATRWLSRIDSPFTLVSGDSDLSIAPASLGQSAFEQLAGHPLLNAWYAQNARFEHPKLHALPIGLDYHTMWENPGLWGLSPVSAVAQEHNLLETLARAPETSQRYLAAYCNWTHALERGDRKECLGRIDQKICFLERHHVPRAASWSRQSEFLFTVSPEGAGMDCHRTWETLLLGSIPIIKRNPLSVLFQRLPVLIVEDWAEVRRERLERHLAEIAQRKFDYSTLFRETWMRKIRGQPAAPGLELTPAEFRRFLIRGTA